MVKYVGIVSMGPNYSAPDPAVDAYVWDTLDSVRASMRSIARGYGVAAHVAEWDESGSAYAGYTDGSLTPCADDVTVLIWHNGPGALDSMEREAASAYRLVRFGPRGGITVERI